MLSDPIDLPEFGAIHISENPVGWGPVDIPEEFDGMPYQPFAKDARLGRVADWSGNVYQDMKSKGRYISQFGGAQFAYIHDEDESNFQLVSSGRDPKPSNMRQRYRFPMRGRRPGVGGAYSYPGGRGGYYQQNFYQKGKMRNISDRDRMNQMQNRRWNQWGNQGSQFQRRGGGPQSGWRNQTGGWGGYYQDRRQPHRAVRDASIQVKDTWPLVEELEFTRLAKLMLPTIKDPSDIIQCGEIEYYDKSYDRVSTRNERPLVRVNRVIHTVSTSDDPIIRRLAKDRVARVYCTDSIAACLMCCTRSVYPWDIIVTRVEDLLFFDVREKSEFDFVTVCETSAEPPMEEPGHINSARRLSLEATYINANLTQQMLLMGGKKYSFPEPNPFIDDEDESSDEDASDEESDSLAGSETREEKRQKQKEELGSCGYRYRLFDLGNQLTMLVRCAVHGALPPAGSEQTEQSTGTATTGESGMPQLICIRALNEFDSRYSGGIDWRSKLETQRGAVLASEIKNNSFKLAKWTTCSILAGADLLKLGFVSRVNPKDSSNHVILGTQQFKPNEFALQLNLNLDNAWGILRCFVDFFMKLPEGKYLLMKDPNKPSLKIHTLPADAFESDDNEDSADEAPAPRAPGGETQTSK